MHDESSTPTKICRRCGVSKPATTEFFSLHSGIKLRNTCRPCRVKEQRLRNSKQPETVRQKRADLYASEREDAKAAARAYYAENREHCQAVQRRGHYMRKYGCTPEFKEQLLDAQGGVCAICGKTPDSKWHLDHDHATGCIRGVLCSRCNQALGLFGDDPKVCAAASDYLSNPVRIV